MSKEARYRICPAERTGYLVQTRVSRCTIFGSVLEWGRPEFCLTLEEAEAMVKHRASGALLFDEAGAEFA